MLHHTGGATVRGRQPAPLAEVHPVQPATEQRVGVCAQGRDGRGQHQCTLCAQPGSQGASGAALHRA
ncbi:hypothetical protein HaLaN_13497, partial [Haematococcus lacustris]